MDKNESNLNLRWDPDMELWGARYDDGDAYDLIGSGATRSEALREAADILEGKERLAALKRKWAQDAI